MWPRVRQLRRRPQGRQCLRRPRLEVLENRRVLASIIVNSDADERTDPDDGIVTLRDAIAQSNGSDEVDTITFSDNVSEINDAGVSISRPVVLDGGGRVVFSGSFINQALLTLRDHFGSTVSGFIFSLGPGTALEVDGGGDHSILGNVFQRPDGSGGGARTGIEVRGSQGTTIGGLDPGDANVFLGLSTGILVDEQPGIGDGISSLQTKIIGNLVGVDAAGNATSNSVGITIGNSLETEISGNTISGNSTPLALNQESSLAVLTGNRIGLAPSSVGDIRVSNFSPVFLGGSFHEIDNNVISGSATAGLHISGSEITVTNNKIGTNSDGTAGIGNGDGILVDPGNLGGPASNNIIGPGNLISGNSGSGIEIQVTTTSRNVPTSNTITGNTIGLNADKSAAIANRNGIVIQGAQNTLIDGNVIAGNSSRGIEVGSGRQVGEDFSFVDTPAIATTIAGNLIGVPADNADPIPNESDGIRFGSGAGQALIGAVGVAAGGFSNLIEGNEGHGIRITEPGRHRILGNKIVGNERQDFDTGPLGENLADDPDVDGISNPPVITEIREGSTFASVRFVGQQTAFVAGDVIEFFNAATGDFLRQLDLSNVSLVDGELRDEKISDDTLTEIQATVTIAEQTSEFGGPVEPSADLLIKGTYENDVHFGGLRTFQRTPSGIQRERIFRPVDPRTSSTRYSFQFKLENISEDAQIFLLKASVGGDSLEDIRYLRSDGSSVTETIQSNDGLAVLLEGSATETFLIEIEMSSDALIGEEVTSTIQVFEDGASTPSDAVIAVATNNLIVTSNSDESESSSAAILAGIIDIDAETPGQQATLRAAIDDANEIFGANRIDFELPLGQEVIDAGSAYPTIQESLVIDGLSGRSIARDALRPVEIQGPGSPNAVFQFEIPENLASNYEIRGLAINNANDAITVRSESNGDPVFRQGSLRVSDSFLGLKRNGTAAATEMLVTGIRAKDLQLIRVHDSVIANVSFTGLQIANTESVEINEILVGTDPQQFQSIPAGQLGISLVDVGSFILDESVIGSTDTAVSVRDLFPGASAPPPSVISNSFFGLADDDVILPIQRDAIRLSSTTNVTIIDNLISHYDTDKVVPNSAVLLVGESSDVRIQRNLIGTDRTGTELASEVSHGISIEVQTTGSGDNIRGLPIDDILIGGFDSDSGQSLGNTIVGGIIDSVSLVGFSPQNNRNSEAVSGVTIQGNSIGVDATGALPLLPSGAVDSQNRPQNGITARLVESLIIGADETIAAGLALGSEKHPLGNQILARGDAINVVSTTGDLTVFESSVRSISGNLVGQSPNGELIDSVLPRTGIELIIGELGDGGRQTINGNTIRAGVGIRHSNGGLSFLAQQDLDAQRVDVKNNTVTSESLGVSFEFANDVIIEGNKVTIANEDVPFAIEIKNADNARIISNDAQNVAVEASFSGGRDLSRVIIDGNKLQENVEIDHQSSGRLLVVVRRNRFVGVNAGDGFTERFNVSERGVLDTRISQNLFDSEAATESANRSVQREGNVIPAGEEIPGQLTLTSATEPVADASVLDGERLELERRISIHGIVSGPPGARYLLEFFPTTSNLSRIGGQTLPPDIDRLNTTIVQIGEDGTASFDVEVGGFEPDDQLTHLTATATELRIDETGTLGFTTSAFASPIEVTATESAVETVQVRALGSVDDSQLNFDPLTQILPPVAETQWTFSSPAGSISQFLVLRERETAGGDDGMTQRLGALELATNDQDQAVVQISSRRPINGIEKVLNDGTRVTLTPESPADTTAGIRVDFADDLLSALISVDDNGLADHDPNDGVVVDPFAPLLLNAFESVVHFSADGERVLAQRDGVIELTDVASSSVLQSTPLHGLAAALFETAADGSAHQLTVDLPSFDGIDLPDPLFVIGGDANDAVTLHGPNENDLILPLIHFDGGEGFDQLLLTGKDVSFALSSLADHRVSELEEVGLIGTEPGSLTVRPADVVGLTDEGNRLVVSAGLEDTVDIGDGWTLDGFEVDGGRLVRILTQDDVTLRSIGPSDWTNPVDRFDVNASGDVSALDALLIINELNRERLLDAEGNLPPAGQDGVFTGQFLDVLSRGTFSALDALNVINHINRLDLAASTPDGEPLSDNENVDFPPTSISLAEQEVFIHPDLPKELLQSGPKVLALASSTPDDAPKTIRVTPSPSLDTPSPDEGDFEPGSWIDAVDHAVQSLF
ncbi:MAG: right-handed parallel beta-helix repeat-containing protein [Planctomycetota bacterium]